MLKRIYAHNYKSLLNFEFRPGAVNLLVGRNGSGKSSLFEVLAGLQDLLVRDLGARAAFPPETLTRGGDEPLQRFEFECSPSTVTGTFLYVIELEQETAAQVTRIRSESLLLEGRPLFRC